MIMDHKHFIRGSIRKQNESTARKEKKYKVKMNKFFAQGYAKQSAYRLPVSADLQAKLPQKNLSDNGRGKLR